MPRKKLEKSAIRNILLTERNKLDVVTKSSDQIMLSLSGGIGSAVAAIRAKKWWSDRVVCVFADTCSEDSDLYRFLDDLEPIIGPITRLKQLNEDGTDMDIWDCFDKYGVMTIRNANGACKASVELKQKPLNNYMTQNNIRITAVGFGFTEPGRMVALNAKKEPLTVVYPLVADPLLADCDLLSAIREYGIEPPSIYAEGFVHNNCLGAGGCVLSGLSQFAAVKRLKPEVFEYAKTRSQAFFERTGFSVLKDQRGGQTKPYTLEQLEKDIESGRKFDNRWMSNCACMGVQFSHQELEQI